jgi:ribose 1,5-bisphosphokinase PhnN
MAKRPQGSDAGKDSKRKLSAKQFVTRPAGGTKAVTSTAAMETEPITISIVKWVSDGRYVFENLEEDVPMYQYQIKHETRPSVLFQFLSEFT